MFVFISYIGNKADEDDTDQAMSKSKRLRNIAGNKVVDYVIN